MDRTTCKLCGYNFKPRKETDAFCCSGCKTVYGLVGRDGGKPMGVLESTGVRLSSCLVLGVVSLFFYMPTLYVGADAFPLKGLFLLLALLAVLFCVLIGAPWVIFRAIGYIGRKQFHIEIIEAFFVCASFFYALYSLVFPAVDYALVIPVIIVNWVLFHHWISPHTDLHK